MKVKAKHCLNVDGKWRKPGEVFEVESLVGIGHAVEVIADPKPVEPVEEPKAEPKEKPAKSQTTRRTRNTK